MQKQSNLILLALTVLCEVSLIAVAIYLLRTGESSASVALDEYTELAVDNSEQLTNVDRRVLSGSEVKNWVFMHYGDLLIMVTTKDYPDGFYDMDTISDKQSLYYVPDETKFNCKVVYNSVGAPVGIMFTESGVTEAVMDVNFAENQYSVGALDKSITSLQVALYTKLLEKSALTDELAQAALQNDDKIYRDESSLGAAINSAKEAITTQKAEIEKLTEELQLLYTQLKEVENE